MGRYSFSVSRTWVSVIATTFAGTIGMLALFQQTLFTPEISSSGADQQPLVCSPKSTHVAPEQDLIVFAEGGRPPYRWDVPGANIAYITTAESIAIIAFSAETEGRQEIIVTSGEKTARCSVIVR
ncbi:MAG: hypothetical protein QY311_02295 [Candidatus Paceibacterota bacterium]|nr:MAG: hypothetical protein QY311_02295 [Candidatus Paceibacterota bacterium]